MCCKRVTLLSEQRVRWDTYEGDRGKWVFGRRLTVCCNRLTFLVCIVFYEALVNLLWDMSLWETVCCNRETVFSDQRCDEILVRRREFNGIVGEGGRCAVTE